MDKTTTKGGMVMVKQRMVSFPEAFIRFWTTWTGVGRASRSEYWFAVLFVWFISFAAICISNDSVESGSLSSNAAFIINYGIWIAYIFPLMCLSSRRLHDIGKSGWLMWVWIGPDILIRLLKLDEHHLLFDDPKWLHEWLPELLSEELGNVAASIVYTILLCTPLIIAFFIYLRLMTRPSQTAMNKHGPIPNMPPGLGNFCPKCETAIPEIAIFCPYCGTRVIEESACDMVRNDIVENANAVAVPDNKKETSQAESSISINSDTTIANSTNGLSKKEIVVVGILIFGLLLWALIAAITLRSSDDSEPSRNPSAAMTQNFKHLMESAKSGSVDAQHSVGVKYYNGEGVSKDYEQAAFWIKKAADQGNTVAQNNLGILYLHGHGVPKDAKEAVRWFTKAAEQGSPEAMEKLADCYQKGIGVKADMQKSLDWSIKAASSRIPRTTTE